MVRFRFGSLLLLVSAASLAACVAPGDDSFFTPDDAPNLNRYQIVVESVEFSATKPGGEPWDDAYDGRPDPCVLVGDEWAWYDMTPIAFDEYSPEWYYVTYTDYSVDELQAIGLTINDEDVEGEDDGEATPTPTPSGEPTPEPTATPTDNGVFCDKIEGNEIGVEGESLQVGTTIVTFHDWVLKAGQSDEYHGFAWDQTGTVDIRVKAGNQTYIASGGSWMHPEADTANAAAISNVEVCVDSDDQLHNAVMSLVPDNEEGQTFVIEPGPGKGVERLIISVQKSEWSSDW